MAPPPMQPWRITDKRYLTPTKDVFELKLARPPGFQFRGGQYLSIVIPGAGPGGRNLRRAYSIASPPEWDTVELCIKTVEGGPGTTYLNSLNVGQEFQAQGPFGDFYLEHDLTLPCLFIGTGTGLAPLRSMILSNEWKTQADIGFLLGVRSEADIIYPEFFEAPGYEQLKGQKHVKICLSRPTGPWQGFRGRVTDYMRGMEWPFEKSHYYLCGSGAMIAEVKEWLANKGVQKDNIHVEKYF